MPVYCVQLTSEHLVNHISVVTKRYAPSKQENHWYVHNSIMTLQLYVHVTINTSMPYERGSI